MEIIFWIAFAFIAYTYIGYPIILGVLVFMKRHLSPRLNIYYQSGELPEITLVVACFNEGDILQKKIENTLLLDYPVDKRKFYFVTDGSTDNSKEVIQQYPQITLFHEDGRKGKNAAVNRVMHFVKSPIVIFCDANTFLNKQALQWIARHYKNESVGAVAGEKRVSNADSDSAASSGEGAYWKYESQLKKWDSELHTVVGAAGELFSIRTSLYEEVPKNVLIEDFRLSMNIAKKGYRVIYEPEAYAIESGSASMEEEHKRKVRISAGGLIEVWHFMGLLNFFKYGLLSFQYVSHRMLRWTLAPLSLFILLLTNCMLALSGSPFFIIALAAQIAFYIIAMLGYLMRNKKIKFKILFVPYYFLFMNISVFQGLVRLIKGKQSAIWDKAKRAEGVQL
jgi:poly-beta-1,6-N-acetyl-D-glucosamine synthase